MDGKNSLQHKCRNVLERLIALVFLIVFLPTLLLIGFVLRANSDQPVLVTDQLVMADGTTRRIHRFRTTGRGSGAFRVFGRFLRSASFDELPGLWDVDVVRGQIGLREFFYLSKHQ